MARSVGPGPDLVIAARAVGGCAAALAVVVALPGCSDGDASGADDDVRSAGSVGAPDSDCPLPVTFDVAEEWRAEAISRKTALAPGLESIGQPGAFRLACEIDAKPAGYLGYIRVFTGPKRLAEADPETLLRDYVKDFDDETDLTFSTFTSDSGLRASEVAYVDEDELRDEGTERRAFLVAGPKGVVLVNLGGLDDEEFEGMLPAYEIARRSVRIAQ